MTRGVGMFASVADPRRGCGLPGHGRHAELQLINGRFGALATQPVAIAAETNARQISVSNGVITSLVLPLSVGVV